MTTVHHRYATVNGQRLFYREAGPADAPTVVLPHGFPARVIAQTRQYLNDADDLLRENDTAAGFFTAMLQRYPDRRLGATILWAGTSALYADTGNPLQDALAGWFNP
jgi:pimeloyl-ACP methyl ester carboxylesterase